MGARTTTAPTPTGAEQNQARNGLEGAAHRFAPLWPLILGLAFGRAGLIVASYGSYTSTDEGIFTDGAMLVALVVLALFLVFIVLSKRTISKHVTNVIMRTCVALEAFVLMALAVFDLFRHRRRNRALRAELAVHPRVVRRHLLLAAPRPRNEHDHGCRLRVRRAHHQRSGDLSVHAAARIRGKLRCRRARAAAIPLHNMGAQATPTA
ncbi:hypothetical protein [Eggerthella lenta]|uniref:hypothetical protein n=1 Tax=Eggerthella lenta TaxID=84112 RepID=UPI002161F80E|nr:hypothetical protein [Eggerthella lenta]